MFSKLHSDKFDNNFFIEKRIFFFNFPRPMTQDQ